MPSSLPVVAIRMPHEDYAWTKAHAAQTGMSASEILRAGLAMYRAEHRDIAVPDPDDLPAPTPPITEEDAMPVRKTRPLSELNIDSRPPRPIPGPKTQQAMIRARRDMAAKAQPLPAKIPCPSCSREVWPDQEGNPRYHDRPAMPGEEGYSAIVPTFVACNGRAA